MDRHRIICGDTTDEKTFGKLLGDKKIDLIVTDPPYNVDYQGFKEKNYKRVRKDIENDNIGQGEFNKFITVVYKNFERHLKPGGVFYIFYAESNFSEPVTIIQNLPGLNYRQQLI